MKSNAVQKMLPRALSRSRSLFHINNLIHNSSHDNSSEIIDSTIRKEMSCIQYSSNMAKTVHNCNRKTNTYLPDISGIAYAFMLSLSSKRGKTKVSKSKEHSQFKSVFFNFISFCLNFLL